MRDIWGTELKLEVEVKMVQDVRGHIMAQYGGCSVRLMIASKEEREHESGQCCPKTPSHWGEGSLTQWVHCEYIVSSGAIHPHHTQWVHAEYFMKEPINLPTKNPVGKGVSSLRKNPSI